ncbi:MAG: hypothetical protein ACM3O3_13115 [Syntrophothermus sp.]
MGKLKGNYKITFVNMNIAVPDDSFYTIQDCDNILQVILDTINGMIEYNEILCNDKKSEFYGLKMLRNKITMDELKGMIRGRNNDERYINICESTKNTDYCVYIKAEKL